FNGRRAVFTLQEIHELLHQLLHGCVLCVVESHVRGRSCPAAARFWIFAGGYRGGLRERARRPAYRLPHQLDVEPMVVPTLVNVLLALLPRAVIAVMHTTIIRASMTAYSTAVGPSSRLRKFTTFSTNLRI